MSIKIKSLSFLIVIGILVILAWFFFSWYGKPIERTPSLFLIPKGYVGQVEVKYGQSDYPAIPKENGYLVHKIPQNGVLLTSTKGPEEGQAQDKFHYIDSKGNKTEIDPEKQISAETIGQKDNEPSILSFIVGTKEESKQKYGK